MADLPEDRLYRDLPPFSHVGIDYFGPIEVKRGRAQVCVWGVIFTCLVSRARVMEMETGTVFCRSLLEMVDERISSTHARKKQVEQHKKELESWRSGHHC